MRRCESETHNNKTEPKFPFIKRPKSGFLLFNLTEENKFILNNNEENNNNIKSLKDLRKDWKRKIPLDFSKNERKFSNAIISPEVIKSKNLIKEMVKPDILQLKKPKWNNSVILEKRFDCDSIYELSIYDKRKFTHYSFNENERSTFRKFSRQKFLRALYGENKQKKKKKEKKKKKNKKKEKKKKKKKKKKTKVKSLEHNIEIYHTN